MNILVVHETEYIEKVVYEFQIIPEIWASRGHHVYVIDFPVAWKKKGIFDFGRLKPETLYNVQRAGKQAGVTLIRPGVIRILGLRRLSAFINYFFLIPQVIKRYQIDKIFLYSIPTNGLQTVYWAKKLNVPVHFRLLDVLHQLVPGKILMWPTYVLEKLVYSRVTELTAITPKLTRYAIKMGANQATTSYLQTGSDLDQFHPQAKDEQLLEKYRVTKDNLTILFAGTLYYFSGLARLVTYLGLHKDQYKLIRFLIVGHGEQKNELQDLVRKYDLEQNVTLTGFVDYSKLAAYINLADVCINPFEINKITNIIFPSKIYQYLACEKPVIATRLAGLIDLFPDKKGENNIYYFDANKPKEFFDLATTIHRQRAADKNLSLQQIADVLEKRLKVLHCRKI